MTAFCSPKRLPVHTGHVPNRTRPSSDSTTPSTERRWGPPLPVPPAVQRGHPMRPRQRCYSTQRMQRPTPRGITHDMRDVPCDRERIFAITNGHVRTQGDFRSLS